MKKSVFLALLAALLTIFVVEDRCRSGPDESAKVEISDAGQVAIELTEIEAMHILDLLKIEAEIPHDSWEPAAADLRLYAGYLTTDENLTRAKNKHQGRRARDGLSWRSTI